MNVRITASLTSAIRDHAAATYPDECCGLLTGRADENGFVISEVHSSDNLTGGDPRRGFEIDPKLRFDLMRALEAADDGRHIVGHYHSHPDHPAAPSQTDLDMAYEPAFVWLICAVGADGATDLGAFRPNAEVTGFDRLNLIEN